MPVLARVAEIVMSCKDDIAAPAPNSGTLDPAVAHKRQITDDFTFKADNGVTHRFYGYEDLLVSRLDVRDVPGLFGPHTTRKGLRRMLRRTCGALLVAIALQIALERDAAAYLDPGTGSYLFQLAIAGLLSTLFVLKSYWRRLIGHVRGLLKWRSRGSDGH